MICNYISSILMICKLGHPVVFKGWLEHCISTACTSHLSVLLSLPLTLPLALTCLGPENDLSEMANFIFHLCIFQKQWAKWPSNTVNTEQQLNNLSQSWPWLTIGDPMTSVASHLSSSASLVSTSSLLCLSCQYHFDCMLLPVLAKTTFSDDLKAWCPLQAHQKEAV